MTIYGFLNSRRGAYFFLFLLVVGTLGLHLVINSVDNLGDIGMYIAISQAIDNGSILYKDVVDTKNTGFLFFIYWIYKPYSIFFPLMNYFIAYMNTVLILFYIVSAGMLYELLRRLSSPLSALGGTSLFIFYLTLISNNLNFNQPQYALFTWLILALYLSSKEVYKLWDYFIIGILLGINVISNSPSILLTLIVPILLWYRGIKVKDYFIGLYFGGGIAFAGFLLTLLPYFWYFYKHDALLNWWMWQVEFPQIYSPKRWASLLENMPIYGAPWSSGTTVTRIFATIPLIASVYYLYCFIRTRAKLSTIILLALLLGLSRMIFLSLGFSWYTLYYLPFVVLIFAHTVDRIILKDNKRKIFFFIFWVIWCIGTLFNPIGNYTTWSSYDKKLAYITIKNPEKHPNVFVSARPVGFTYSTKWKYIYYNIYGYPEKKDASVIDNNKIILQYMPEACIIGSLYWGIGFSSSQHPYFDKDGVSSSTEQIYPTLEEHYTRVSDSFFIRNDKVSEWDLSMDEEKVEHLQLFLSIWDVFLKALRIA